MHKMFIDMHDGHLFLYRPVHESCCGTASLGRVPLHCFRRYGRCLGLRCVNQDSPRTDMAAQSGGA
jgi:hypothetical protein